MNKLKSKKFVIVSVSIIAIVIVAGIIVLISKSGVSADISSSDTPTTDSNGNHVYDYLAAPDHIGERATVTGKVYKVMTSKSGVTFFDFCESFRDCPFSAVIFASDLPSFADINQYERDLSVTGVIKAYQGKAEMVLSSPDQIK